ncbi:MAG: single-stranded DNA-binding protein [Opitutales bacterium]
MASFNKVILMGNLTRDPETRQTPGGMVICKLGLAVSRKYSTQQGEQREETTFVDVDCFGKQAEVISKYMSKGRPILIEGRLRLDQWETQSGEKRNKMVVVCENFQFVGGRGDNDGGGAYDGGGSTASYERSAPAPRHSKAAPAAAESEFEDDDVPF